jgi:RNA polymerase sigma-70 factor (ECF subfamily)
VSHDAPGQKGPPAPRRFMTDDALREALARLVTRTTPLDEEEIALLDRVYPYLMTTHYPAVWAQVARPGLSQHDAEDVAQEVFIDLFRVLLEGFPRSLPAMLNTIAERKRGRYRRDNAHARASVPLPSSGHEKPRSSGPEIERILDHAELRQRILAALSPEHRDVIEAHYMDGLSSTEAAEALGLSEGTFKSRLLAARRVIAELAAQFLPPSQRAA